VFTNSKERAGTSCPLLVGHPRRKQGEKKREERGRPGASLRVFLRGSARKTEKKIPNQTTGKGRKEGEEGAVS